MDYLKKYNLNDEDIKEIIDTIDEMDYKELIFNQENVETILRYFIGLGITNLKNILMYKTYIFYDSIESIKESLNKCDINTIKLINEDIMNFELIGL